MNLIDCAHLCQQSARAEVAFQTCKHQRRVTKSVLCFDVCSALDQLSTGSIEAEYCSNVKRSLLNFIEPLWIDATLHELFCKFFVFFVDFLKNSLMNDCPAPPWPYLILLGDQPLGDCTEIKLCCKKKRTEALFAAMPQTSSILQ